MAVHHLLLYAQELEKETKGNEERANKRTCYRKHEYQDLDSYKTLTNSGRANFDRFLRALDMYFDLTGFRLGYMQEKLMHEIIVTFLRVMYGKDLLSNLHDIEKRFAVRELRDATAILYPRRAGKTKTQTIAGGCIVVSQPIGNCSCYNIGGRQARDWLQEAYDVMRVFEHTAEFGWTLDKANALEFVQIKTAFGTINRISSYPGIFQGGANIGHSELGMGSPYTPLIRFPPLAYETGHGFFSLSLSFFGKGMWMREEWCPISSSEWHGQCMHFLYSSGSIMLALLLARRALGLHHGELAHARHGRKLTRLAKFLVTEANKRVHFDSLRGTTIGHDKIAPDSIFIRCTQFKDTINTTRAIHGRIEMLGVIRRHDDENVGRRTRAIEHIQES